MKIIAHRKYWLTFSAVMFIAGIVAFSVWGLRLGADFTGGSLLEVRIVDAPSLANVQSAAALVRKDVTVQAVDGTTFILKSPPITEAEHQQLVDALKKQFPKTDEVRFDSIGPVIGQEIKSKSIMAIILVTVMVLCYIAWSFRRVSGPVASWTYAIIVIASFMFSVIIPLGIVAAYTRFTGTELTSAFIAAVLTILGYSINDTIVVFDRVRENLRRMKGSFDEVVDASIRQSITRSISTGTSAVLALVAIYLFGGESLELFSLTLILGIVMGTFSSIFMASPLLVVWYNWKRKR